MPHPPRTRLTGLAGALVGSVLLVAGCSDPAPTEVPSTVAPTVVGPSTASPTPSATPSASSAAPSPAPSGSTSRSAKPSGDEPSVVPSRPVETAPPKKLDEPTRTAGARISLTSVRATDIKAKSPADSSGPGVLVGVEVANTTGKALDLSFVSVTVEGQGGRPGTLVDGPPTRAVSGSLKKGASVRGTYAFLLDDARSAPVTVAVYVTSGQPVVTFRGRAS